MAELQLRWSPIPTRGWEVRPMAESGAQPRKSSPDAATGAGAAGTAPLALDDPSLPVAVRAEAERRDREIGSGLESTEATIVAIDDQCCLGRKARDEFLKRRGQSPLVGIDVRVVELHVRDHGRPRPQ